MKAPAYFYCVGKTSNSNLAESFPAMGCVENYTVQNLVQVALVQPAEEHAWSGASKCGGLKPAAG